MGLTSALNTSLNGLVLNETSIDVLGNNIANAGTNGFKASSVQFTTQLSRTLSVGSRPTTNNGGTNPRQIGLGATTAAIRKDFTQGSVTNSTSPSDLAIQGDGFFVLDDADGNVYSRNGNFTLNSANVLVTASGARVQGYGVDADFNLITTQLADVTIPLGNLNVAQQTANITMSGALLPTGELATQGSRFLSEQLVDTGTTIAATAGASLTDLETAANPGVPLFQAGDVLTFSPRKTDRSLEPQTLTVTGPTGTYPYTGVGEDPGTTLQDLMTMMDNTLGFQSGTGIDDDPNKTPAAGQPGVDVVAGQIQFVGNQGTVNQFDVSIGDLTRTPTGSTSPTSVPIDVLKTHEADGESVVTDFVVFDSLGEAVTLKMTAVLDEKTPSSTTFRWFVESADDSDVDVSIANGAITFDGLGNVISGGSATFSIDRDDSAAISPMQITADLSGISGISSSSSGSTLSLATQDGSDPGTLTSFVIDETGVVNGIFDNGVIRTLGQVVLARFANTQGLVESGDGTYQEGVGSGSPFLTTPGNFGAGTLRSGAIELSNTDIGRNLVDLIVASTNYRGNARVISSVQQLVDELLILGR
ncbi:MAG: flagellar hook-basal body complex protein [Planctomycetaceae bacterium]|nr:flagellar hook-basal body complex protein [Planctomycetaceae bacterium]